MYFADFRANFCVFFYDYFVLRLKKPLLLEQFYDNNWLQFRG